MCNYIYYIQINSAGCVYLSLSLAPLLLYVSVFPGDEPTLHDTLLHQVSLNEIIKL